MTVGVTTLTIVHVALSLIGIFSGIVVMYGILAREAFENWTRAFLGTTIATSATGFLFPADHLLASHVIGGLSLLLLAIAILARYAGHLRGIWGPVYAVCSVFSLYLNVFVLIAQLFLKVSVVRALAPTQSEPPFLAVQSLALLGFVVFSIIAAMRSRHERFYASE